jgi:hypothetical protein
MMTRQVFSYRGQCGCVGAGPFYAYYRRAAITRWRHAAHDGFAQDSRKRGGREYLDVEAAELILNLKRLKCTRFEAFRGFIGETKRSKIY